jgi:hypothetical protein
MFSILAAMAAPIANPVGKIYRNILPEPVVYTMSFRYVPLIKTV